jgi:hypothetical protein
MPSDVQIASLTTLPTPAADFVIPGQRPGGDPTRGVRIDTLQGLAVDAVEAGPVVLADKTATTNVALRGITTFYVDYANGNDAWDGLSRGTPKKNLSTVIGSFRRIILAPGFHQLSGTISIATLQGLCIEGAAEYGSILVVNGNYDAIAVSGLCDRITLKHMLIVSFVARASGAGLRIAAAGSPHSMMELDHIKVQNTHDGVILDNVQRSHIGRIDIEQSAAGMMAGNGLLMTRVVSTQFGEIVSVAIPGAGTIGGYACLIDYDCDTVGIDRLEVGRSTLDNLAFGNSLGVGHTGPRLVRIGKVWAEASSANGVAVYSCRDLEIGGLSSNLQGLDGLMLAGGHSIRIVAPLTALNNRYGINVAGGSSQEALKEVTIIAPDATNNSQASHNSYAGISVTASGTPVTIIGGRSGDHDPWGTVANKQNYGIDIGAGANYATIIGTDLTGNATAPIRNQSTGLNNHIQLRELDNWQVPHTWEPALYSGLSAMSAANDALYFRVHGAGPVSKIAFMVGNPSGNISVAVYRGLPGRNAPTTRIATSGAVATPAAGKAEVSLGSTVWVQDGDWFCITCDNATTTFGRVSTAALASNALGEGTSYRGTTQHPAPSSPTGLTGSTQMSVILVGWA